MLGTDGLIAVAVRRGPAADRVEQGAATDDARIVARTIDDPAVTDHVVDNDRRARPDEREAGAQIATLFGLSASIKTKSNPPSPPAIIAASVSAAGPTRTSTRSPIRPLGRG